MLTIAQRVDNGFNALMRMQRDFVDLTKLDMQDPYACMLAQAVPHMSYVDAASYLAIGIRKFARHYGIRVSAWTVENGFDLYPAEFDKWAELTTEWRRRLAAERNIDAIEKLLTPIGAI